ncbi:MAG TPA: hypothetical protein PLZ13_14550, partial [Ottowia sp.]|nr:hypothetical protein [Ottowia sp.]
MNTKLGCHRTAGTCVSVQLAHDDLARRFRADSLPYPGGAGAGASETLKARVRSRHGAVQIRPLKH